ncbi:Uncharacterized protein Adt_34993 [Abeliophyllum distichum]|uniref:Uncharacterized protein n=1 Tax=Abeliophyllum distichum TaxID=126358 RepID=A0ABD1QDG0_9LAMI
MEKYDRRGDLTDHINMYKTRFQGYIPVVKCRNFHTTLVSNPKRWYNKLEQESIRSWPQMKQKFINTFIGNWTMIANVIQIHEIDRRKENREPKTYTQLVDLIQREIRSEDTIENREKAKREKGDRYHREGRISPKPRTNRYQG